MFEVKSFLRDYSVAFPNDGPAYMALDQCEGDFLVIDANVSRLHSERIGLGDDEYRSLLPRSLLIDASEVAKSVISLPTLLEPIIRAGFTKTDRIVAIGGGVVQDIAGFIASVLYRGVEWIFYPTTLLAQCDSCIGGKTSLNFSGYKNLVGTIYPPWYVVVDHKYLDTLPERQIMSGLGEMAHFFFLHGRADFEAFAVGCAGRCAPGIVENLIRRSLHIKRIYIETDEFDRGVRRILNYGHSFGHAIEAQTDDIPHGIAVAWGMEIANRVSRALGYLSDEDYEQMAAVLEILLAGEGISISRADFLFALSRDKKRKSGEVGCARLILTRGPGAMFETVVSMSELELILSEITGAL